MLANVIKAGLAIGALTGAYFGGKYVADKKTAKTLRQDDMADIMNDLRKEMKDLVENADAVGEAMSKATGDADKIALRITRDTILNQHDELRKRYDHIYYLFHLGMPVYKG